MDVFYMAFGKVNGILLRKLHKFGFSVSLSNLIKSYFQNKYFVVKHNEITPSEHNVNSGVLQGSNIDPLLFILFINDYLFKFDFKFWRRF